MTTTMTMQLSREARWMLRNQYRILERLDPDAADECRRAITVLERGYSFEYHALSEWIEEPMSEEDCREVIDILEMHRELRWGFDDLADKTAVDARAVEFRGFDGNHESRQLGYARFLLEDEDKWKELAGSGDGLNSHMPVMEAYRRMLPVWLDCVSERRRRGPTSGHHLLDIEEIQRITAARVHPDNRVPV
jgi:uncharacterized protein YfbU (UPF0304 family)